MEELSPLWKEILSPDFRHADHKSEAFAHRIIEFIDSHQLVEMDTLPSVRALCAVTKLSKDTIGGAFKILVSGNYLVTAPGKGTYIKHPLTDDLLAYVVETDTRLPGVKFPLIQADQYCMSVGLSSLNAQLDKTFQDLKSKYYKEKLPKEQNAVVGKLIHTLCSRLNNVYKTAYCLPNIYYAHDFHFILRIIGLVLHEDAGVVVIPRFSCNKVRMAFKSANLGLLEVNTDEKGFCVDELDEICKQQKVTAVYLMSNANYPDTLDTDEERLKRLLALQRRYHFTIIEDDRFASWFTHQINPLLSLASELENPIIYLRPVSLLQEELSRLIIVASTVNLVSKISLKAADEGFHAYQSIANAANDLLLQKTDLKVQKVADKKVMELGCIVHEIFSASGFWKEEGIRKDAGVAFFIAPIAGRFPADIFKQLGAMNIRVANPVDYNAENIPLPGIRISLAWYIGKKTLKTDLLRLEKILRALVF